MNIVNPTNFGIPGLTLTTTNSEGTGNAIRTGASILAFDATDPAAVGASAVVGSATVASRRDHVHAGVGTITSTDEAIARYNGTGGALQNYTSAPPLISDAGVITLASGQIIFPATQNASGTATCLDDFEKGTWEPNFSDSDGGTGSGQTYHYRIGNYVKIGQMCWIQCRVAFNNNLGGLSGNVYINNLPFPSLDEANNWQALAVGNGSGWSITAGESGGAFIDYNKTVITLYLWDGTLGSSNLQFSELTADGGITVSGCYRTED